MAIIENINVSSPNDNLGDSLRDSQIKANNNFEELNDKKVEKIAGKDLSENDFTDTLKTKLDSLEVGAGVQIQADWIQTDNLALDYIKNKPDLSQYFSAAGGFDYEDLATQTTPLNYTTGYLQLTNDILGANTKTNLGPYGVTKVWDDVSDAFDFNELSIGDEVFLRVHLNLTTTTANQISGLRLLFAEGLPSEYILPIDLQIYHKTAGTHDLMREIKFYLGNEDWRISPVKIQFNSDANATIKVHGFHPYIIRKSVNILDVNDDNYKTFEIANIEANLDDTTVADGRISLGYNLATSKINAVLFDAPYSSYIYNYDQLKLTYDFSLNFFDKTNGKSYTSFITGFTQIGARYKLDLNETLNYTDYAILDKLEVFINATKSSTATLQEITNNNNTTTNDIIINGIKLRVVPSTNSIGITGGDIPGGENIGIGLQALLNNLLGALNIAIGNQSQQINNSGQRNISIGYLSLGALPAGLRNLAIGVQALSVLGNSSDNIGIGDNALSNLTSGNKNLGIGAATTVTNGLSNQINIWDFLYKDASGAFGIDISTPTAKLDVNGDLRVRSIPTYTSNANALSGGLAIGNFYIRTGHGLDVVV